jgi:hypothetical protein
MDAATIGHLGDLSAEKSPRRKKTGRFDDNLVCIISDLHCNPDNYQEAKLRRTITEILAMNPLPRNVIALGDLAYLQGKVPEYLRLKEIVAPWKLLASNLRWQWETMTKGRISPLYSRRKPQNHE